MARRRFDTRWRTRKEGKRFLMNQSRGVNRQAPAEGRAVGIGWHPARALRQHRGLESCAYARATAREV